LEILSDIATSARACSQLCGHSMGTTWSVQVVPALDKAALGCLQRDLSAVLADIIAQMSHWEPNSLLARINRAAAGWYQVPPAFFEVVSCAVQIARLTDGAYDPTVGELVQLWGFGAGEPTGRPPDARQLAAARQRAGWQKLHLNVEHRGVWQPGGLALDFSSIAKGYGVDVMARVVEQHGIEHYMVELGGELRVRGQREDGTDWQLWVETPASGTKSDGTDSEGLPAGIPIALHDLSIATSGDYRRYFLHEGRRYAHTLDPRSGWALQNNLASVSVIHPQCMAADALSTALLCMGLNEGLAFARQQRIAALFMCRSENDPHDFAVEWTDDFYQLAHPENPLTSTTDQSARLAVHGKVKRGNRNMEPKAPLTCGGDAPTARSEFFIP